VNKREKRRKERKGREKVESGAIVKIVLICEGLYSEKGEKGRASE
jgi:hypothetical protein